MPGTDSLLLTAQRAAQRIASAIDDIGEIPYNLIRPVLAKVESPERLHQLEQSSPHIVGLNDELWMNFIKRDIPKWQSKRHQPENAENWYRVYRKLKKEADKEMGKGEDQLKAALAGIKKEMEDNRAEVRPHHALPRARGPGMRAAMTSNYINGRTGAKGAFKMSAMQKIRHQAAQARNASMNKPTHELKRSVIAAPPRQFVEDVAEQRRKGKEAAEIRAIGPVRAPRRPSAAPPLHAPPPRPKRPNVEEYHLLADRERRLKALQSRKPEEKSRRDVEGRGESRESPVQPESVHGPPTCLGLSEDFLEDTAEEPEAVQKVTSRLHGSEPRKQSVVPSARPKLIPMIRKASPPKQEQVPRPATPQPQPSPHGQHLSISGERPRSMSPSRIASPKPVLKRKAEQPQLFMPKKRPAVKQD